MAGGLLERVAPRAPHPLRKDWLYIYKQSLREEEEEG